MATNRLFQSPYSSLPPVEIKENKASITTEHDTTIIKYNDQQSKGNEQLFAGDRTVQGHPSRQNDYNWRCLCTKRVNTSFLHKYLFLLRRRFPRRVVTFLSCFPIKAGVTGLLLSSPSPLGSEIPYQVINLHHVYLYIFFSSTFASNKETTKNNCDSKKKKKQGQLCY